MKHIDIKEVMSNPSFINQTVTVCGWVRTSRDSKNVAFIELNDGTSLKHLPIVIDKASDIALDQALKLGTSLKVTGTVVEARQAAVEINASSIEVLGVCPPEYPLQKKRHTLEFLRTMPTSEEEQTPSTLFSVYVPLWLKLSTATSRATTMFM